MFKNNFDSNKHTRLIEEPLCKTSRNACLATTMHVRHIYVLHITRSVTEMPKKQIVSHNKRTNCTRCPPNVPFNSMLNSIYSFIMTMQEVCGISLSFTQQIMASRAFRILQQKKQQQLLNRFIHIKLRARAFEFLLPEHPQQQAGAGAF